MKRIHPLMASRQSADYRQPWQMSGVWRRSINFVAKSGELLTLHRRGSGFSPGGWILRGGDFDALRDVLTDGEKPQSTAAGIQIGEFLLCEPERRCSLRVPRYLASPRLNATYMQRSEETGLFWAVNRRRSSASMSGTSPVLSLLSVGACRCCD
ncbi:putative cytoplasmic protein [Salmonella enterica subsp. enterica]|nr:putative cytoplasmic protein [Salmonella enterica subsp. enterica]